MGKNRHVVRAGKVWHVKIEGSGTVTSSHRTQRGAIGAARNQSGRSGGGEVKVHGVDGRFRTGYTIRPANDPYPPRG